jgi:hypothetical protein
MSADTLFSFANYAVLLAWLLLFLAPRWEWTQRIVHAFWIPLALAFAYGIALVNGMGQTPEGGDFFSLSGVMLLFTSPWAALAGWLHYLAFDLFVGAWEVRDAGRRGLPHAWVCVCLFFTLMLGPLGLGLYALGRLFTGRGASLVEANGA